MFGCDPEGEHGPEGQRLCRLAKDAAGSFGNHSDVIELRQACFITVLSRIPPLLVSHGLARSLAE